MASESLLHDVAWATALHVLEVFNLRDEEKREAFGLIYERVKDGIEGYDIRRERMQERIKPSLN